MGDGVLWRREGKILHFTDYTKYDVTVECDILILVPAASATADPTMAPIALSARATAIWGGEIK